MSGMGRAWTCAQHAKEGVPSADRGKGRPK
jgi:hypothetical protein